MRKSVNEQLRRFREREGIGQAELARRLGITPGAVSKIENRDSPPRFGYEPWARALGAALDIIVRHADAASLADLDENDLELVALLLLALPRMSDSQRLGLSSILDLYVGPAK